MPVGVEGWPGPGLSCTSRTDQDLLPRPSERSRALVTTDARARYGPSGRDGEWFPGEVVDTTPTPSNEGLRKSLRPVVGVYT